MDYWLLIFLLGADPHGDQMNTFIQLLLNGICVLVLLIGWVKLLDILGDKLMRSLDWISDGKDFF